MIFAFSQRLITVNTHSHVAVYDVDIVTVKVNVLTPLGKSPGVKGLSTDMIPV